MLSWFVSVRDAEEVRVGFVVDIMFYLVARIVGRGHVKATQVSRFSGLAWLGLACLGLAWLASA